MDNKISYSIYSNDDNDSDDDGNINYSHKRSSNVHRISTKKGELLNELLSKDPKFKQEMMHHMPNSYKRKKRNDA